jgi:carboxyl-terminal processing protease
VILDLRNNPGGLLEAAVEVSENFVKKGEVIVSTKGRTDGSDKEYRSEKDPQAGGLPLVVLVNENSASASEIVTGAIQDLDRGVIIGETTYGKGLVQTVVSLNRDAALKITTAKYYVPSGRCIQKDRKRADEEGNILADPDETPSTDGSETAGTAPANEKESNAAPQIFHTKNGRPVYGGGGIKPDIEVLGEKLNRFEAALRYKSAAFNYAVAYASKHPNLPQRDFQIDDNTLSEFRQFIRDKKFTYTSQSEMQLAELKKTAEKEGYLQDIQGSVTALEQALQREKDDDFTRSQNFIRRELEQEIAAKLFGSRTQIEVTFDDDPVIKKAAEVLSNAATYAAVLSNEKSKQ